MKNILKMIAIIALFWACDHKDHNKHEIGKIAVSSPQVKDTTLYKDYVCQIHAYQHIELRSMEKGFIEAIYVDEGSFVKKGQILFKIKPIIYQAEQKRAAAELKYAEIELDNTKALADSQIVSQNEYRLSQAEYDKALANYHLASAHLGFTEIRAPFDGIVGRFNEIRLGSLVEEGELLSTLSDNSKMWVYFNVPERAYLDYITHDHEASEFQVELELANKMMFPEKGIIETIEADLHHETGNIAFRATFPNPNGILRNGGTGLIYMPLPVKQAMLIPQKACFEILDKVYVYRVVNGVTEAVPVEIVYELPHLYVIHSDLSVKDKIVVSGLRKIHAKQKIETHFVSQEEVLKGLNNLHAE